MARFRESDIYFYKNGNLFFNLIKITDTNIEFWKNYARIDQFMYEDKAQRYHWNIKDAKLKETHGNILRNIGAGRTAFSVRYGINEETEQYVMLASYEPILDPNVIDTSKLAMTMMVTTSINSPFTTHMGISRTYASMSGPRPECRNLSAMMHAFPAYAMSEIYDNKIYMINAPLPVMRDIIFQEFKKLGFNDAMFASKGHVSPTKKFEHKYSKEDCLEYLASISEKDKLTPQEVESKGKAFWKLEKNRQSTDIKSGKDYRKLIRDNDKISIYGHNRELIAEFDRNDPGEYRWFTTYPHIFCLGEPLIVFDLNKMAQLREISQEQIFTDPVEFKRYLDEQAESELSSSAQNLTINSENKSQGTFVTFLDNQKSNTTAKIM